MAGITKYCNGVFATIAWDPNQVPVKEPQIIVPIDNTYNNILAVDTFFVLACIPTDASKNINPYPASPIIIAKNKIKNIKNHWEISPSRYPGTVPRIL